ncbi:glycoside hydrolase family 65 protein [Brevundimonas sp. NIBR11]|uniref:glycoside hydrolase family 65 protein n=1 Tax=Brevundimonas sp. NIBR11 TaxID=3015999 RepID=UPI0022F07D38|nr:glycoside hydrolase family 65 protein [Brevundimonas sp. NIBR11]WGM30503.1 Kojibiose phosphorylase [Brevundimonas sp. NIBR11]
MTHPISPPQARGPRNGDLPAYVGNGLVGLRVREQPLQAGMMIVSGFAGEHPERRIEAAAPAPYPLAGDLALDGVWLSDQPTGVSDLRQSYDFATGELTSSFRFEAAGTTAEVTVLTFASRTAPSIVLQEVSVQPDRPCDVELRAVIETAGVRGGVVRRRTDTPGEPDPVCDGSMLWASEGGLSSCGLALVTQILGGEAERSVRTWDVTGPIRTDYRVRGRSDRPIRLRQMAGVAPSVIHERPDEEAVRRVARARATGFDCLRERNRAAWADLWDGRIVVHGATAEHQAIIDAAVFYLNCSTHPASPAATSIFGLATWHDYTYYFGHVMWDIDAFCVPPLLFLQPEAARAMLDFRTRGLEAARGNARLSGRRGLQFPWEAAPLSGEEASPGGGDGAAHEDHGSLHTARAFGLYADVTGDPAFLDEDAWPVLSGVADWIVSRVTRTDRGFELLRATGPAEVPEPPDNDAFTLMAAGCVLRRAIRAAEQTGRAAPEAWRRVEEALYLPVRSDGVIAAHDGFRISEPKGATPSPLAGLFPYDHPAGSRESQSTLDFYLEHWSEYVGAPMFPAFYATWAAMAGDRDLALKLFEEGYAAYDQGRFHQCLEYRPDHPDSAVRAGPFFANLGGMLMGLMFGLPGIRVDDGDPREWAHRPVVLPRGWTAIEIGRVWIRGRPMRLVARDGADRAELIPL